MISPLLDMFLQYGGAVAAGLVVALFSKKLVAHQMKSKIHDYQGEIVRSHSRILTLEAQNDKLEKRVKQLERPISSKEPVFMN